MYDPIVFEVVSNACFISLDEFDKELDIFGKVITLEQFAKISFKYIKLIEFHFEISGIVIIKVKLKQKIIMVRQAVLQPLCCYTKKVLPPQPITRFPQM